MRALTEWDVLGLAVELAKNSAFPLRCTEKM